MANPKLTVKTPQGTFSRRTARGYTHVVIVQDRRAHWLEFWRLEHLANARQCLAEYERGVSCGRPIEQHWYDEGKVAEWIETLRQEIAKYDRPPIIDDEPTKAAVYSWSTRHDLAVKYADEARTRGWARVWVYDVATGQLALNQSHDGREGGVK